MIPAPARRIARTTRTRILDIVSRQRTDPIFVLGNQKSGTTAVARLLAYGTDSSYSHDMFFRRGWTDVSDLHTGTLTVEDIVSRGRSEFAKKIIKDPDLTFHRVDLHRRFPRAQFVFVARDPAANIKSILERHGLPGEAGLGPESLPPSPLWRSVFDPRPLDLEPGDLVQVLAQRWARAACQYLAAPRGARLVRYEDFKDAKEDTIRSLVGELGLEWRRPLGAHADTQFQPRGSSKPITEFFDPACLDSIGRYTASEATQLGYSRPDGDDHAG